MATAYKTSNYDIKQAEELWEGFKTQLENYLNSCTEHHQYTGYFEPLFDYDDKRNGALFFHIFITLTCTAIAVVWIFQNYDVTALSFLAIAGITLLIAALAWFNYKRARNNNRAEKAEAVARKVDIWLSEYCDKVFVALNSLPQGEHKLKLVRNHDGHMAVEIYQERLKPIAAVYKPKEDLMFPNCGRQIFHEEQNPAVADWLNKIAPVQLLAVYYRFSSNMDDQGFVTIHGGS